MADEPETMAEVRARANSHDGCPTDIFDRALAAHDARVRAEAGAQALRDAADDLAVRANEPGLIELADRYQGYYAGVRSAMQDAETKLRARADTITQEDTP